MKKLLQFVALCTASSLFGDTNFYESKIGPVMPGETNVYSWTIELRLAGWTAAGDALYGTNYSTSRPYSDGTRVAIGSSVYDHFEIATLVPGQQVDVQPYTSGWYWGSRNNFWLWSFTPDSYLVHLAKLDWYRLMQNSAGGAVQAATGVEASERTLFRFSGARDWSFTIGYNSAFARGALAPGQQLLLGRGWSHNFQTKLVLPVTTSPFVYWSDNNFGFFVTDPSDSTAMIGAVDSVRFMKLKQLGDGTWLLTRSDQSSLLFSSTGVLLEDRDPQGRKLVLARDGSGRVSTITEPISGTSLTLTYNANGAIATLTDNSGATVQLTYSGANGDLTKITNQRGYDTSFTYFTGSQFETIRDHNNAILTTNTYNSTFRVSSQQDGVAGHSPIGFSYGNSTSIVTDRAGKTTTYTYDGFFNVLTSKNHLNHTTTYTYDSANRVTSVTDPLGRTTTYTYDSRGNLLTATDPAGKVTTFTYDVRNNLLTTTDPVGGVTTRTYDANNNLLTLTDALGRTTTWTYDANSLPLTMTLPGGGVTTYAYTAGRLTQVTDPQGVVTRFGYDALGHLLYREDALGKRVSFTYDALGNVLTVTNATGQTTTYTYDHRNRVASVTDPAGAVTTNTYDHNNNLLTATVTAAGLPTLVTSYTYDGEDRLKTVTTPDPDTTATGAGKDPLVTTYHYDDAGRLTSVVAPTGTTTYAYDAASQLVTITAPDGKSTTSEYNSRGLLTKVTDPLTRATNLAYDDAGRRATATDPLGRLTQFQYDALHRLTQVTDPGALVAQQGFDLSGNRTSLTNPANAAIAFAYDSANRLTSETTPMGRATGYTYDPRGLLATVTEPSTQQTAFSYDDSQRLLSTTDAVGTITLGRDSAGRVTTVTENGKTLTRAYNAYGWLTSFTDGDGNTIGYTYDNLGRITKLTYPGTPTKEVLYGYDAAGRLHTVTDWAGRITTYSYDAVSRLAQILRPNGTKQVRTYDAAGQLISLTELAPDGTTVIYSGSHSYDLAGQLTSETLTPSLSPPAISATQTFDADNRLLTHNGSAVTFDADGNLLTIASGVAPASYTYDARNRLTSAGPLSYGYDAENRRTSVTDASGTTTFVANPNASPDQVLIRTKPDGTKTFYVYGLGLLHEETDGTPRFYHFDRRGDTIALTDSTGTVTGRAAYGVYGELISQSGTLNTPFLFNGRWGVQSDANGLYHHRARYYHPALRRFLNQDSVLGSIASSASMNRFAYANGNPVTLIDPFGLMAMDITPSIWDRFKKGFVEGFNRQRDKNIQGFNNVGYFMRDVNAAVDDAIDYGVTRAGGSPADAQLIKFFGPWLIGAGLEKALVNRAVAAESGLARQTTVLGENMTQRVMPFAEKTGGRTLGFGATADEWAAMTPQQRWRLNDGMLRARINEGDAFRYIGQDPLRNPAIRQQFDLTRSELLRLESRNIPYEVVSPTEVRAVLGRP